MTVAATFTHHITLESGGTRYGFKIRPGSYRRERADDFAPRISTGNDPKTREGLWDSWAQNSAAEGIDQLLVTNVNKVYRSDGLVFLNKPEAIMLDAAWNSSDAGKVATAPMAIDFLTDTVLVGVGTKVRNYTVSTGLWADSTTTLGANVVWLHRHGVYAFAGVGNTVEMYRTADGLTWTQVATTPATQPASCLTTWENTVTVNLVLGVDSTIKLSTDSGVTWGAAINVGNAASNVTGLGVAFGLLIIGKEDGLYSYDGTDVVTLLEFPNSKNVNNCKALVYHEGFLYTHLLGRVIKLSYSSGAVTNMVDITPLMVGDENRDLYGHGTIVWMWAGVNHLYTCFDDGESVYPEVLYYTGLGWHQAYRGASGDTMRAGGYSQLAARTFINDGATRARRHLTIRDVPFPDYPASAQFETSDFDGSLPFMLKAFRDISLECRNLDTATGRKITVDYSTNKGVTWTAIGTVVADGKTELSFDTSASAVASQHVRLRFTLTRGSTTTETPVLERFAASFLNRPNPLYIHSVEALFGPNQALLDGTVEPDTTAKKMDYVKSLENTAIPVRFVDDVGTNFLVLISKTSMGQPSLQEVANDQRVMQIVMVDAVTGLWPQIIQNLTITVAIEATLITKTPALWGTFVWGQAQWEP